MRLIDADALKENFPLPCEEWEMKGQQTLWDAREIREMIDRMPTVEPKTMQWIPCSVEKPKKTGYYICTCHDGVCYRTSVLVWSTGWVLTGVRAYWRVIAWMPLPKPWKGEEDDAD